MLVSFEGGHPSRPVVLGALWNGADTPPVAADAQNTVKMLRTRGGSEVRFDDTSGEETVEIRTASGQSIRVGSGDGGVVEITDGNGNTVTMGSAGLSLTSPELGTLDVDGIWLEGEHGGVDYADLGNLTRACDLWGKTSVVRVMDNDYATIYRTLDRGAQGIVVPHVNTREEAEAAVAAAKFAPLGKRGMFTSRQGFGVGDYLRNANEQSLLIVLIEDIAAIGNLSAILEVDHIDAFFVAPSDLATSMGHIGRIGHREVQQTIDAAVTSIVGAGRVAGTLVNSDNIERYTRLGVRVVMTGFFPWIQAGVNDLLARAAAGARG